MSNSKTNSNETIKAARQAKSATSRKRKSRTGTAKHETREQWLNAAVKVLRPRFAKAQREARKALEKKGASDPAAFSCALPRNIKVTCGWPSKRGTAARGRVIGECWSPKASTAKATEVFVSPYVDEPVRVLDILMHELIHAALGTDEGHGPRFALMASLLGLAGKPTATIAGEELAQDLRDNVLPGLGRYPHAKMDVAEYDVADRPKKQHGSRMVKVQCDGCGYTVRTTRKWLEVAIPACPNEDCDHEGEPMTVAAAPTPRTGRPREVLDV